MTKKRGGNTLVWLGLVGVAISVAALVLFLAFRSHRLPFGPLEELTREHLGATVQAVEFHGLQTGRYPDVLMDLRETLPREQTLVITDPINASFAVEPDFSITNGSTPITTTCSALAPTGSPSPPTTSSPRSTLCRAAASGSSSSGDDAAYGLVQRLLESERLPHEGGTNAIASFDKLRMRDFLRATKIAPHPELVEGRTLDMQAIRIIS